MVGRRKKNKNFQNVPFPLVYDDKCFTFTTLAKHAWCKKFAHFRESIVTVYEKSPGQQSVAASIIFCIRLSETC